jgi:hypothetical protein
VIEKWGIRNREKNSEPKTDNKNRLPLTVDERVKNKVNRRGYKNHQKHLRNKA